VCVQGEKTYLDAKGKECTMQKAIKMQKIYYQVSPQSGIDMQNECSFRHPEVKLISVFESSHYKLNVAASAASNEAAAAAAVHDMSP
jgi:hypothetical protein